MIIEFGGTSVTLSQVVNNVLTARNQQDRKVSIDSLSFFTKIAETTSCPPTQLEFLRLLPRLVSVIPYLDFEHKFRLTSGIIRSTSLVRYGKVATATLPADLEKIVSLLDFCLDSDLVGTDDY